MYYITVIDNKSDGEIESVYILTKFSVEIEDNFIFFILCSVSIYKILVMYRGSIKGIIHYMNNILPFFILSNIYYMFYDIGYVCIGLWEHFISQSYLLLCVCVILIWKFDTRPTMFIGEVNRYHSLHCRTGTGFIGPETISGTAKSISIVFLLEGELTSTLQILY